MNIILAAHGKLAGEVANSANMVFGQIDKLDTVAFVPGENAENLKAKYQELIAQYDAAEEILFVVDLFGGSPYNAAFETVMQEDRMDVITGLSLQMLIDIVGIREMHEGIKAVQVYEKLNAMDYVKSGKTLFGNVQEEEEEEDEL